VNYLDFILIYMSSLPSIIQQIQTNPLYFAGSSIFQILIFIWILYSLNPWNVSTKYPTFVFLFIISFITIQLLQFISVQNRSKQFISTPSSLIPFSNVLLYNISIIGFLGLVIGLIYIALYGITNFSLFGWITKHVFHLIFALCIITLIYALATPFINATRNPNDKSYLSLVGTIVTYIPCLFLQFIDTIKYQASITTPSSFILIGFIVGLYLFREHGFPWIKHTFLYPSGIPLLTKENSDKPTNYTETPLINLLENMYEPFVFLHKPYTIQLPPSIQSSKPNYNYAYSMKFWIDALPPNTRDAYTRYATLWNHGNQPVIEYNSQAKKLRVRYNLSQPQQTIDNNNNNNTNNEKILLDEDKSIDLLQRWNHLVLNYDHGTMDIFLNGTLIRSTPNISPYYTNQPIIIGEENGIEGKCKDVLYFNRILSTREIQWME
jgi:hypothetical protein